MFMIKGYAGAAGDLFTNSNVAADSIRVMSLQNATLDDRPVISLLLTPKDKEASKAIARIQLWVDPETGLPLQHQVFHAMSETRLLVRYLSVRRDDELSPDLFRADWPEGTATIRR